MKPIGWCADQSAESHSAGRVVRWALACAALSVWTFSAGGGPAGGQAQSGRGDVARRLGFSLENARIPTDQIVPGGPPKDGIPALSSPKFVAAARARFLKPSDRVIGVEFEGDARAYPLKILNWHEAVNDRVGGVPVLVTYCPLCDSAAVFDRRVNGQELEFGISGLLYNSNVLLYDRSRQGEESLWSQLRAEAVTGPRSGQKLRVLPCDLTTWADWRARHPDTRVLSTDTGYRRVYAASPYTLYFRHDRLMFPVQPIDRRLRLKTPVLGVWTDRASRAYPVRAFASSRKPVQLEQTLDGKKFTLQYEPTGRSLRVVKHEPGVRWAYAFWFAWYAFHPETELFEGR